MYTRSRLSEGCCPATQNSSLRAIQKLRWHIVAPYSQVPIKRVGPNKRVQLISIFIFFYHPTGTVSTLLVYLTPKRSPNWPCTLIAETQFIFVVSFFSKYWQDGLLGVIRQNIAGWCQQTFCFKAQQCFAFTPWANFPTHNLNFYWRWRLPLKIFSTLIKISSLDCY